MIRLLVAAPGSGSGKTSVTAALLWLLAQKGLAPAAFKVGPDYIDPTFHRAVQGIPCRNLDLRLSGQDTVRRLFAEGCAGYGAAVVEGVMGFYDGEAITDRASSWRVAHSLGLPVLLVLRPGGSALTAVAALQGLLAFRRPSHIAGILLNDCSESLAKKLAPCIEKETGVPVLGALPHQAGRSLPGRHLGLVPAGEGAQTRETIQALGEALEQGLDWGRFVRVFSGEVEQKTPSPLPEGGVPVAVARDEAFLFCYEETLETFCKVGLRPVFFSPLRAPCLPEGVRGLYLPGGYPELHTEALDANRSLLAEIKAAVKAGLPTVAECGGYMLLCEALEPGNGGAAVPMAGVLPGTARRAPGLVRFGYADLTAGEDSLLFRAGETVPVHCFHHWDSTETGTAFALAKAGGEAWREGFATGSLYAGYPHLYFAGAVQLAERFARVCESYNSV